MQRILMLLVLACMACVGCATFGEAVDRGNEIIRDNPGLQMSEQSAKIGVQSWLTGLGGPAAGAGGGVAFVYLFRALVGYMHLKKRRHGDSRGDNGDGNGDDGTRTEAWE